MSIFSSIRVNKPKKTAFDLSFENKLSCNMGDLVPVFCKEVLPGDKFSVNTATLVRFSPLRSPVMQSIDVYMHYFFVPNRLLMPQKTWENFITGGPDGNEAPQLPYIALDAANNWDLEVGTLWDYLGYPVNQRYLSGSGITNINLGDNPLQVSTLPLRAYQLIWQEYYRDQNLGDQWEIFDFENADVDEVSNGGDYLDSLCHIKRRAWKKDYFTSALPFVQRGAPVTLPLGGQLTINQKNASQLSSSDVWIKVDGTWRKANSNDNVVKLYSPDIPSANGTLSAVLDVDGVETTVPAIVDNHKNITADLGSATSITMNDLRRAEKLQQWLERNARGGARYIEQILSHFGVISSDARLQRPEYLGGGSQPVTISEVLQTSQTEGSSPQGNMAGHAISGGNTMSFKRKFEEHGFIIGIMSILPRASYSQGCPKMLTRFDKFDYAFPEFAHLGEQPVLNREVYLNGTDEGDGTFGYQSVYADYKFSLDEIHGDFKTSLAHWHQGRIFANEPSLNEDFVTSNPSLRIFADTEESRSHCWCELFHSVKAIRPLPKYGTPMF